ncbi:MAG: hypothetical protein H6741_04485 [Alphaproteobacteria bacterium]|nr:hypothetical protein [Alphaproteobacteria bacterium]
MAQISDWISRMFNNGPAQGLSGGGDDLPLDPREAYFHGRMRRHETGDDIIESPLLLWSASSPTRRRTGLREHLLSQQTDGPAYFTDILVVINEADYRRTLNQVAEPWTDTATRVLGQEFEAFSRKEAFQLPFASRSIRFRVIRDGGQEMGGHSMGLIKGEYVTGLLPNLYSGPLRTSRPILAFHLALPGVWEGYQEVGRMYSDQVQFTLGSHWLDSASHPALREPALYLVQQYLDGSLDPRINPDLRDRYAVSSQQTDGVDVQTISSREDGTVVAYLVVALMDSFLSDAPAEEEAPVEEAPPKPAPASMNLGYSSRRDPEPARPEPMSLKAADTDVPELELDPSTRPPVGERPRVSNRSISNLGQKTIVPDAAQEQIFTLKERGALLQKVHFRKFMKGYDVYISQSGAVSTHAREPAATFQVREDKVTLVVHRPEVTVNGAKVALDQPLPLYDRTLLMVGPHSLEYNDLTGMRVDGWPYLGEILRPAGSTHMVFGGRYRIGRDRRCKVQLPDEPHNENIVWLDGASSGATIRARSGEIPKSRFYTDSIMVASEHAEIDLREGVAAVNAIARHCFTFVRRGEQILPLFPTKQGGTSRLEFEDGDDLLVGNCLFRIDYGSAGAEASTGPAPALPKRLTADSLARAVEIDSDFGDLSEAYEPREGPPPRQFSARERLGQLVSGPFSNEDYVSSTEPATVPPDDEEADEPTEPVDPKDLALDAALSARGHKPFLSDEADLPPAHGLGERGPAPPPPKIPRGFDSIMGELPQTRTPSPGREPIRAALERESIIPSALPPPQRSVGFGLSEVERIDAGEVEPPEPGPTFAERPDFPTEDPFDEDEDEIIAIVNEERWQMEMARPARLLLLGWAISGEAVVGNYRECAVVVPESRSEPHQLFHAHEYFKVKVRSNRGKAQLLDPDEARMRVDGEQKRTTLDIDKVEFEIIRRDADGDEDFSIMLRIDPDIELPDPRARLLAIAHSDRMAQALFTVGFPQAAKRKVRLGPVRCYGTFVGGRLTLSDYLRTYRQPDGRFLPFFIRKADGVFRTVPEDGREVVIEPGDQVLVERSLYEFKAS